MRMPHGREVSGATMPDIFHRLVDRYFAAAMTAVDESSRQDKKCVEVVSDRNHDMSKRIEELARWIRFYKVHRVKWETGVDANDQNLATAVARLALELFDNESEEKESVIGRFKKLRHMIGKKYYENSGGKDRSFLSLTSKVLWCRSPECVPIYDQFAVQAVTVLAKIYKAQHFTKPYTRGDEGLSKRVDQEFKDWNTRGAEEHDIYWYQDFFHSHELIFGQCRKAISGKLSPGSSSLTFRVFDKILWLFGNEELDYSLMGLAKP
jgi:hypothetical protein